MSELLPARDLPAAPMGPLALPAARAWGWRVAQWPLCRIVLAASAVLGALSVGALLTAWLQPAGPGPTLLTTLGRGATLLILLHLAYLLYVRFVEWRRAGEVSLVGAAREAAVGALIGGGLMSLAVGCLWLAGCYHVAGVRPAATVVPVLGLLVVGAYWEELLLRVIVFRILEEWLGTGWSLALSAAAFAALHLRNPHATAISTASIALAGVLLGAAFAVTRRIWLPAGLHFAWNFVQGGVFGVPVSGFAIPGLLAGSLTGPPALSGGAFGVEGSVVSVALCAAAAAALLTAAARRGHLAPALWARGGDKHAALLDSAGGGENEGSPRL
ncbi:MAG TPA: CPBP family intramembrane glutamic endopeptidase [Thermoanaerobaculia bacterium]|nr:CPBP family intramembrane glutamic endopeptidase [Thermoanaerobaculia bacterium]